MVIAKKIHHAFRERGTILDLELRELGVIWASNDGWATPSTIWITELNHPPTLHKLMAKANSTTN